MSVVYHPVTALYCIGMITPISSAAFLSCHTVKCSSISLRIEGRVFDCHNHSSTESQP